MKSPVVKRIEKRNWLILGAMVAGSILFFRFRVDIVAGVVFGGLISIAGFMMLERLVVRFLSMPAHRARVKMVAYHYGRLAILFGVLALLFGFGVVDPYALTVGLSVVVINLLLTTVLDAGKMRLEV